MNNITNKQVKMWLLQRLYDNGYRYLTADYYGCDKGILAHKNKPEWDEKSSNWSWNGFVDYISDSVNPFGCFSNHTLINIAEELGITDWSRVQVNGFIADIRAVCDKWERMLL